MMAPIPHIAALEAGRRNAPPARGDYNRSLFTVQRRMPLAHRAGALLSINPLARGGSQCTNTATQQCVPGSRLRLSSQCIALECCEAVIQRPAFFGNVVSRDGFV